jgi:hypothetical protein
VHLHSAGSGHGITNAAVERRDGAAKEFKLVESDQSEALSVRGFRKTTIHLGRLDPRFSSSSGMIFRTWKTNGLLEMMSCLTTHELFWVEILVRR